MRTPLPARAPTRTTSLTGAFAARRLGWALVTAFAASIIAFVLFWTIPNVDPSYVLGGAEHGTNQTRAQAVETYGLDHPLPTQYTRLMGATVSGEVECFYRLRQCAHRAFGEALPVTISLIGAAALIAVLAGVGLALVCVRYRGRWHLLLQWIAASLPFAGAYVQLVRSSLLQTADRDQVRTARAKGLSEGRILRRHVLRNELIPPVTIWASTSPTPSGALPCTSR
jgi:ABC-type dipeptide/oligopeptide/nickel transport system permease component